MHAAAGHEEILGLEGLRVDARHIARNRGPQRRQTALMGIEGLAFCVGLCGSFADELRRRPVSLADPERDQPLPVAAIIEDIDNAAIGRCDGLRADAGEKLCLGWAVVHLGLYRWR